MNVKTCAVNGRVCLASVVRASSEYDAKLGFSETFGAARREATRKVFTAERVRKVIADLLFLIFQEDDFKKPNKSDEKATHVIPAFLLAHVLAIQESPDSSNIRC